MKLYENSVHWGSYVHVLNSIHLISWFVGVSNVLFTRTRRQYNFYFVSKKFFHHDNAGLIGVTKGLTENWCNVIISLPISNLVRLLDSQTSHLWLRSKGLMMLRSKSSWSAKVIYYQVKSCYKWLEQWLNYIRMDNIAVGHLWPANILCQSGDQG